MVKSQKSKKLEPHVGLMVPMSGLGNSAHGWT